VQATTEQPQLLLLLRVQQNYMLLRQLSCSGLGHKPPPTGCQPLVNTLQSYPEVAARAEAANALLSHRLERAWPLLRVAFHRDAEWLLRCGVLSSVAEHPEMDTERLLQMGSLASTAPTVPCGWVVLKSLAARCSRLTLLN